MNCKKCQENISAYIDGELKPRLREKVEAHLKECSACRTRLEMTKQIVNHTRELHRLDGDIAMRNRVIANVHQIIKSEPLPKSSYKVFTIKRVAFAGVPLLAILIILGIVFKSEINQPNPPFEFENLSQSGQISAAGKLDEASLNKIIELIKYERLEASSHEIFSEHIRGVFIYEPLPLIDNNLYESGKIDNIKG